MGSIWVWWVEHGRIGSDHQDAVKTMGRGPSKKTKNNGIKSKIYDIYLWSDNNYMRAGEQVEN